MVMSAVHALLATMMVAVSTANAIRGSPQPAQRTTRVVRSTCRIDFQSYYSCSMIPVLDLAAYSCTYLLLVVSTATSTRAYPNRGTVILHVLVPTILLLQYYTVLVSYR